jgi:DNA-damage-inducible protein J
MTATTGKVRTNVYLDASMKEKAQEIFKTYGMGLSDAFNIFLSQSVLERGIPFQVKIPNDVTLQAMQDVEDGKNMEEVSFDQLVKDMDKVRSA